LAIAASCWPPGEGASAAIEGPRMGKVRKLGLRLRPERKIDPGGEALARGEVSVRDADTPR
jgi:hypothetical protein